MRFNIEGEPMPVVVCELESGEMMITEKGAMSWMSPNMQMNTVGGGIGKMFGRMVSGESMFLNTYTAMNGQGTIAFASSFPGCIRAFEIQPGSDIVCQKSAFLASTSGVELSVFFRRELELVSLAEKDLLCSDFLDREWHLLNLTAISKSICFSLASQLS